MRHHGEALRKAGGRPKTPADDAIREYAVKLARVPQSVEAGDVDALRAAGLSDRRILETNLIVSCFCFVNRIAHGLGVELESYWK